MDLDNARRTIYGRLNELSVKDKPAYYFAAIRDDFKEQFLDMKKIFVCIQLLPGHRIHLNTPVEAASYVMVNGFSFRGFPIILTAAKFQRNVRLHRLAIRTRPGPRSSSFILLWKCREPGTLV